MSMPPVSMPPLSMPQCLLETTHTPYASIHVMMEDIGFALKKANIGVTHFLFHPEMQTDLYTLLLKELAAFDAPRMLFDINGKSNPAQRATPDGSHILDRLGIQQLTFLTDNPCQHLEYLKQGSDNGILLYIDRDFGPLIDRLDLPYSKRVFFPHGGPDIPAPAAPLPERRHDLLFSGNIFSPPVFADWLSGTGIKDESIARALDRTTEQVLLESSPVYETLTGILSEKGIDLDIPTLAAIQTRLEHFINGKYRWDVLQRLVTTGLGRAKLTICGEIHKEARLPDDNLNILGPQLFRNVLGHMADSKFLLSLNPNYRNGGHERVFYGMNRGTVVLSSHSRYLEPEAEQGLGVALLPSELDRLGEWFLDLQGKLPRFEEGRAATLDHFLKNHCWTRRLEPVLKAAGL